MFAAFIRSLARSQASDKTFPYSDCVTKLSVFVDRRMSSRSVEGSGNDFLSSDCLLGHSGHPADQCIKGLSTNTFACRFDGGERSSRERWTGSDAERNEQRTIVPRKNDPRRNVVSSWLNFFRPPADRQRNVPKSDFIRQSEVSDSSQRISVCCTAAFLVSHLLVWSNHRQLAIRESRSPVVH